MATMENVTGVIGDLIEINNDRVAGFEKAIADISDENTDLKEIADSCALMPGSYKKMTHEEILGIFKECY